MKILVPANQVMDFNVKARAKAGQKGGDLANVKMGMNPFDEIALGEACRRTEIAGYRHNRSSAERATLCFAAQHHEGEKEAHRGKGADGLWRRYDAAAQGAEGDGAAQTAGRCKGQDGGRADRPPEK